MKDHVENENNATTETLLRNSPSYALKNKISGEVFNITSRVTVGRQKGCDIELADKHISRLQATLTVSGLALMLKHEGSNNSTFVNGKAIQESIVNPSDVVRFDSHEFEVIALADNSSELGNDLSEQDNDSSASTLFLPEVWADAKQKKAAILKSQQTANPATTTQATVNKPAKTAMNNLLSTQVLFADEQNENKKSNNNTSKNIEQGVVHLFGYHPLVHDAVFALNKDCLLVGKAAENNIVLKDASVSSKHAKIFTKKNVWLLEDLNSTNGTFANGQQIKQATVLKRGDLLQFGLIQLVFGQLKPNMKQNLFSRLRKWTRLPE